VGVVPFRPFERSQPGHRRAAVGHDHLLAVPDEAKVFAESGLQGRDGGSLHMTSLVLINRSVKTKERVGRPGIGRPTAALVDHLAESGYRTGD
jgi:hypothetical protein